MLRIANSLSNISPYLLNDPHKRVFGPESMSNNDHEMDIDF